MDTQRILELYENVLQRDMFYFQLNDEQIKIGIESMSDVYKPGMNNLTAVRSNVANYNDPAHRCAYLHKYAPFHTAMVRDIVYKAVQMNFRQFYDIVFNQNSFSLCCLGGGPGNDVVAVMAALHHTFSYFETSVTIVDYMEDWRFSFMSILNELGTGMYGAFGNNMHHFLNWHFVGANLLKSLSPEVCESLGTASLVTMIKFVSATSCKDTQNMINNIFAAMKPGGLLLFVDNDAGGFHELIMSATIKHNFISVFGPLRHEEFINYDMKVKRFGRTSCFKSTVTVHILQKPLDYDYHYRHLPILDNYEPTFGRRVIYPGLPPPSYVSSPLTPYVHQAQSDEFINFSTDENILDNHNFSFQIENIPQSPGIIQIQSDNDRRIVNTPTGMGTPVVPSNSKRGNKKNGCLPFNRWRHNMARKLNNVKSRARNFLLRKPKNMIKHPIFRL